MIACSIIGAEGSGHHGLSSLMHEFLRSDACFRGSTIKGQYLWSSTNEDSNRSRKAAAIELANRIEKNGAKNPTHFFAAESLPAGHNREVPFWPSVKRQLGIWDHLKWDARVLLLRRDPIDCLGSIYRRLRKAGGSISFENELMIACHTIVMMSHAFHGSERDYRFLELDDLIKDPQRSADKVAEYFDIPRESLCPEHIKDMRSGRTTLTPQQIEMATEFFASREKMLNITFPAERNLMR